LLQKNLFFGVNKGMIPNKARTWKQGFKRPVEAPKTQHSANILRRKFHCVDQPIFQKKDVLFGVKKSMMRNKTRARKQGLKRNVETPTKHNTVPKSSGGISQPRVEPLAAARPRSAFPQTCWSAGRMFVASR